MTDPMKRITHSTITDALMEGVERADDMQHILILFTNKDKADGTVPTMGVICNDELPLAEAHWMCALFQQYLTIGFFKLSDDDEGDDEQ